MQYLSNDASMDTVKWRLKWKSKLYWMYSRVTAAIAQTHDVCVAFTDPDSPSINYCYCYCYCYLYPYWYYLLCFTETYMVNIFYLHNQYKEPKSRGWNPRGILPYRFLDSQKVVGVSPVNTIFLDTYVRVYSTIQV